MTQNQLDWMQDNGLDPAEYDMTPDGRVLRKQAAVAQEPEREVMSMPRAFGTSFLGNLVPSAASIAGAAAGMKGGAALGAFGGPVGAAIGGGIGGIGGGLGAGYLAGKGQQALLENYAPEAAAEMQRAETDQPVMSYLGGFAPNALTMSPSVKGLSGLLRPTVRGEETLRAALTNPNFLNPAINVGANVAGSTAGQLVNMSEGGEFSVPRFAADVALGSLFNKPTGLGKRLGFQDTPENIQEAPGDLAKSRDRAELMANVPKEFATPRAERGAQDIAKPGVNIGLEAPDQYFTAEGKPLTEKAYAADYSKWWKSETEPTTELLKAKAEEVKAKIPRDKLKELSNDPEVGEVLRDPSKMEVFVAKQADQTLEDVFQMMENRKAEEISRTEKARVEAEQNAIEIQKLQDLEASQALTDEAAERLQVLKSRRAELLYANKDQGPVQLKNIREQSDPAIAQAQKEVADARAIAEDIWTRLQRPEGKQSNKITQEDINLATELANRRGLKVQLDRAFAGSQEVRGMFLVDKNTGDRIIRINPLMATADTAIHEIGHDIFKGVTNKGMRRSLIDTALDSPAYKAELEARMKEGMTEQAARDIALEEGLVQAFGEKMPDINRGELRAWFSAFKASMKQLVTGKMSPEDALAWMHYATTENVPWKGVATAKTSGQERLQRGEKPPELEALNAQLRQAQEAERIYKQQNPYDREGIKALEADSKKAMNAYFEKSQAYEEANPKYPGIENAPEFLPSEDKYYRSFQDPADDQTGLRHMAQGKIWPDAFVMEIESPRGVIDANNNALRGRFKPEQVTKIIHDVDSFEPYPHDYIAELKRKYPNAEIVDGVLNDREDGYRILGPAKSEPSADSSDVRYQRPTVGQAKEAVKAGVDKTLGEIDQITRRGGIYETVGRAMTRAYNAADAMLGKARSLGLTITKLNYDDATKLTSHLYNEYKNQQLLTPAPEIAAAYKEWRTQAKAFWVDESNKAGHQITTGKGLRDRIESEFWFPGHKLSDEARDILASKIGTPEYQKLKSDYLRDAEADYLSRGKLMTEAQEKALADFEEQRALANKTFDPSAPATFAGARKPMGRPLPESWIEKDFRKTFESYNARSAKDYAAQQHFEKSPEVMAALGSKKFFNNQDIPASVLQNTPVIAPDPSIQSVMREFSGQPLQMPGKTLRSWGAAASALALQTISRIGDVGGTVTKPLAYIGLGDYGAYMGGMAEKLSDWSKLKARSIESGLNNPNANQDFHQVIGMGQDAGKYMQKVLDGLGFITGSSKLESVARTLAQAQGEMIVSINKRKAATGDKDAVRFLDTLNNDWRTQSDMALAAQFGQMMQGTYDMRQLPAWFLEGGAAPYLTWSKWSMSQMNNFRKFAVEPAMQGNLKPLIAQVLVGMAGGGAIEQVQEWLSGKESKAVKWSELESWARQNEGTIGTDGGELLLQKFMIMAQKTGTFGFAGDLAMMPINALVGDTQSSVGVFPAAELFADGMKNVAGALTAIDKGEDVGLVLQRFGKNVIVGKTQMARVASTWVDEVFNEGSENLRSADRRKARLFEELSGTGRSNGMFPVSYENLAEQKFERGSVTEDTGEEAFSLVKTARESATSPEDYASRIRKLKTSQNAIMPSLERQPMKAARYLGFVEGAEPGKGSETLKRYYTRQNEDKYRKSLIEGMSGIR
jgi:GGDEF domain-containing protein